MKNVVLPEMEGEGKRNIRRIALISRGLLK